MVGSKKFPPFFLSFFILFEGELVIKSNIDSGSTLVKTLRGDGGGPSDSGSESRCRGVSLYSPA